MEKVSDAPVVIHYHGSPLSIYPRSTACGITLDAGGKVKASPNPSRVDCPTCQAYMARFVQVKP